MFASFFIHILDRNTRTSRDHFHFSTLRLPSQRLLEAETDLRIGRDIEERQGLSILLCFRSKTLYFTAFPDLYLLVNPVCKVICDCTSSSKVLNRIRETDRLRAPLREPDRDGSSVYRQGLDFPYFTVLVPIVLLAQVLCHVLELAVFQYDFL